MPNEEGTPWKNESIIIFHQALSTYGRSHDVSRRMDFTATENHDELSDYGSDFTPDEEEILSGLLSPAPDHDLDKDADSNQLSSGTEQYERSRSVRFTLGSGCEQQIERSFTHSPERRRINIQYDGEATTDQNCMLRVGPARNTD